jgi:transcriptional regulator with GAF, ATPase, and Fis domain
VPGDTDRHSLVPQECGSLALHLVLPDGASLIQTHDPDLRKEVVLPDQHNVTKAARALGTTRETLRYRIQKYGITRS